MKRTESGMLNRLALVSCNTQIRQWQEYQSNQPDPDVKEWAQQMIEIYKKEKEELQHE